MNKTLEVTDQPSLKHMVNNFSENILNEEIILFEFQESNESFFDHDFFIYFLNY